MGIAINHGLSSVMNLLRGLCRLRLLSVQMSQSKMCTVEWSPSVIVNSVATMLV